ncbi:MAG: tyrosine-type recombinase/integrase, partial [Lentisphaerae bacterium]|nr:tyrosine-type recombinase/integrase [Lentisphaerota bacterium]
LKGETIVGTPKSDAGIRVVSIPKSVKPALKRHLADHTGPESDDLLFPAASGKHLHPSSLMKHFRKARAAAGRDDLRFHDLRHTAATTAALTGATLAELMARMGHSTSEAALAYQHVAAERDKQIAAGIDKLIVTPKGKKKGR